MTDGAAAPSAPPLGISEFRDLAVELLRYAARVGSSVLSPLYASITEGRDPGLPANRYSSCGDLAHWLLMRLGVRCEFLNRREHLGWTVGANVSRLAFAPVARAAELSDSYAAGDILVIWSRPDATNAHVQCVVEHDRSGGRLTAIEAGQSHGAERTPRILERNHSLAAKPIPLALRDSLGTPHRQEGIWEAESARLIVRHLPLDAVLARAASHGLLVDVDGAAVREAIAAGTLR